MCGNVIPVSDTAKHLGILLSSASSTIARTTERITSSRSAFYALSAIGARHSCINPLTSLRLYKAISLPILTFGLDVWSPTNTELSMMERSQVKILRTILGLPVRTSTAGIHSLLGTVPIHYTAQVKLLSFVRSTLALPPTAIARLVLLFRARQLYPPPGSFIHKIVATLDHLCLPDVDSLSSDVPSKSAWKALVKTMVHESFREDLTASASLHPTLSDVSRISPPKYGRPVDILQLFKHDLTLARLSLLRIRLLLHVSSIRSHTSSFRVTDLISNRSDICLLCDSNTPEDLLHFISVCPALQPIRAMWLPKI